MSLPSADATLTLTVPASTPMSPVPGSPLAKMVVPRTTRRVFIYEPRCSITAAGRSRNSEWLRSKDSLSRVRSAGRLPPGIDMSAPRHKRILQFHLRSRTRPRQPVCRRLDSSGRHYNLRLSILAPTFANPGHAPLRREALKCTLGVHLFKDLATPAQPVARARRCESSATKSDAL